MTTIDDLLAPGRALESLVRRAAHGHRLAWRLLLRHTPDVIRAETRWLYPALLHRRPGGAQRSLLLPFHGDHEQLLELVEQLSRSPNGRADPMFRAMQWLLLRHTRAERQWLVQAVAVQGPRDESGFARFVARCRPLLDDCARLGLPDTQAAARAA